MTILANCSSLSLLRPPVNCARSTGSVLPASRSSSRSPTQTMGFNPASNAATVLWNTVSSVSPKVLAPLAVADNDPLAAHRGEHGGGNLSGEGAFLHPIEILPADPDFAALRGRNRRRQIHKCRTDHDVALLGCRHQREKFLKECGRLGRSFVHLPIACYQRSSHKIALSELAPFSTCVQGPGAFKASWILSVNMSTNRSAM